MKRDVRTHRLTVEVTEIAGGTDAVSKWFSTETLTWLLSSIVKKQAGPYLHLSAVKFKGKKI